MFSHLPFHYKKSRCSASRFYAAWLFTVLALVVSVTALSAPALNRAGNQLGGLGKTLLDLGAGAAIGAATGGGLAAAAAGANTDWHNRQLHPREEQRIQELAGEMAAEDHDGLHLNQTQWAQRLRIAAASRIDARDDQTIDAQLARAAWSNGLPGSENYLQSLNSAATIVAQEAARTTPINWQDGRPIITAGAPVHAFQASDEHYHDHNLFGRLDASGMPPSNLGRIGHGLSRNGNYPANLPPGTSRYGGQEQEHQQELLDIAAEHWKNRGLYDHEANLNRDYSAYTGTGEVDASYPVLSLAGTGLGKAGAWAGRKVLGKGLSRVAGKEARQVGGRGLFRFAKGKTTNASKGFTDPSRIKFSQDSIKGTFRDGRNINDLVKGLKDGSIRPSDVPVIRVIERNGQLISIDNRRLAAFKEAGLPIKTRLATEKEFLEAQIKGKFSAGPSGGKNIRIRGK